MKIRYIEGILLQIIFYSIIWLISEYVGLLLCLIMGFVIGALLAFAWMVEFIEKSKVPSSYYKWMLISSLVPLIVALFFSLVYKGNFDWLS
ncbi:MAG: hypothetical protein HKO89_00535 [Saprospiraceae bacterium]|nr:hypothetical protein [Saprospiraceae bacterium]